MPWEVPGTHLIHAAEKYGVRLDVVEVWRQTIPDISPFDGLIVLGGTPDVDQEKEYPFLKVEKRVIRKSIDEDKPYLGFCLGHQLLADVLGARVGPNFLKSIGFITGKITENGRRHPLFRDTPISFPIFKWHAQAVLLPLPKHLEILVTSGSCQVEALSLKGKNHIVGLQFDNHTATFKNVNNWMESDQEWLSKPPAINTASLLKDAKKYQNLIGKQFETMFKNFVKLIP